jgi:hypothetical protein
MGMLSPIIEKPRDVGVHDRPSRCKLSARAKKSLEVTNKEWASLVPWEEVVARSRGRAKYNAIRKVRAQVRRLAIVRRLRQVGFQQGVQHQLAWE